jgi:soluble lytic murein transglycosylase
MYVFNEMGQQIKTQSTSWIANVFLCSAILATQANASKPDSRVQEQPAAIAAVIEVSHDGQPSRIQHAQELLGKKIKSSLVKHAAQIDNLEPFVFELTKRFLSKAHKRHAKKIAKSMISEARRYGFDPLFVMAVIQNESSFNPEMVGDVGEIGLMQVRPTTARWIADLYKIEYRDEKALFDPSVNIKLGVALMDKLRDQFDAHSRLYISAYNIGATKVRSLIEEDRTPREYVVAVMRRYLAIYEAFKQKKLDRQIDTAYESVMKLTRSDS